jgi:hypothetical protein
MGGLGCNAVVDGLAIEDVAGDAVVDLFDIWRKFNHL